MRDIQQQRSRSLLNIHRIGSRQPIANIILRAEHMRNPRKDLRFVLPHPQQLGQREVGQRRIRRQLDQPLASDLRVQPIALLVCPLIAPDQRRPQHLAGGIQHDRPMHLPGEPDGVNSRSPAPGPPAAAITSRIAPWAARHQSSGSCSAQPGWGLRNGACSTAAEATSCRLVDQNSAGTASAYIKSEKHALQTPK